MPQRVILNTPALPVTVYRSLMDSIDPLKAVIHVLYNF